MMRCDEVVLEQRQSREQIMDESRKHKIDIDEAVDGVVERVAESLTVARERIERLERGNIGLTGIVRQIDATVSAISRKDKFWEVLEARLRWHVSDMTSHCCEVESAASAQRDVLLPYDVQKHLAGNTQRIAKILATKSDFEVIREMVALSTRGTRRNW